MDSQRVAEPDVHAESRETDGLRQDSFDEIVDLVAELLLILNLKLLLKDLVNFLDEVGLPAEQLDGLNIVEALIDVETALLSLATLLFANVRLGLGPDLLENHTRRSEEKDDEAAVANLIKDNYRGGDKVDSTLEVGRAIPDEGPDTI